MIPERYLNFLSEISGKFPIGNFGKLPRPIPNKSSLQKFIKHLNKSIIFNQIIFKQGIHGLTTAFAVLHLVTLTIKDGGLQVSDHLVQLREN